MRQVLLHCNLIKCYQVQWFNVKHQFILLFHLGIVSSASTISPFRTLYPPQRITSLVLLKECYSTPRIKHNKKADVLLIEYETHLHRPVL